MIESESVRLKWKRRFLCVNTYRYGLVQEIRNSSASAMEVRLSCINQSIRFQIRTLNIYRLETFFQKYIRAQEITAYNISLPAKASVNWAIIVEIMTHHQYDTKSSSELMLLYFQLNPCEQF